MRPRRKCSRSLSLMLRWRKVSALFPFGLLPLSENSLNFNDDFHPAVADSCTCGYDFWPASLCSSSGCCAVLPGMLLLATASPRHWEHGGPGLLKARVFIGFKVFTVFPMVCRYLSLQPPSRNKIKKWWEFKMLVLLSKPLCCKNMQLSFHRTRYMRCFWGQTLFKQYICSYCRLTLTDKIMETMLGIDRRSPVYIWFHNQVFPVRFQNINDANLTYVFLFAGKGSKLSSIGFACGLEGLKQMTRVFS